MVALTVFAVVAIAVYTRTGDVLVQTARLEQRTFATWVARDQLQRRQLQVLVDEKLPPRGRSVEQVEAFGRTWEVTLDVAPTDSEYVARVDMQVAEDVAGELVDAGQLTGFLASF